MSSSVHRFLPAALRLSVFTVAALVATGCSVLQEDKIDYKSAKRGSTLDVPPDLTQLSRETRYQVPAAVVSASDAQSTTYQAAAATTETATAAVSVGDVRIERAGNQRWLVINRPAEKVWGPVKAFWQESGFQLQIDQENVGIMETDWAENRAKLPQDAVRATLGKLFDNLYSTGERDKFRTRLERTANGSTEVYISHRGMVEVYSSAQKDQTVWQPRAADPELETEFLRRLMVKLGVGEAQAKAVTAAQPAADVARVVTVNNLPTVQLAGDFDRAWRRVGLSLDRSGFTVEDRDRSQGVYFVRYVPTTAPDAKEGGFLSRLFSGAKVEPTPAKYRVRVQSTGDKSTVTIQNAQGQPDGSENAKRIAQLLADDIQ